MNTHDQPETGPPPVQVGVALILDRRARSASKPNIIQPTNIPSIDQTSSRGPADARQPPTPKLLIARRPKNTVYGGYWELPGGKMEPGETPEHCVVREVLEELGVPVVVDAALPEVVHIYEHATVRLHPRVCRLANPSVPIRNLAVSEHRWCAVDDLPWGEFLPANVRVITALARFLGAGGG
ncbi:MAG: (deoxy)nucleoside triphosphate pyrophosphohydrolase [Phycisphaerales bacterium]|nr:(deoxy)nucleoside triphosphate pyrophosphohydrolase [Phycisphaerales bacterium]